MIICNYFSFEWESRGVLLEEAVQFQGVLEAFCVFTSSYVIHFLSEINVRSGSF